MAAKLHAGSYDDADGADTMAAAIAAAMDEEWQRAKGQPLGELGREDRRILFAAVAKGVLRYLHAHRGDVATTVEKDHPSGHSHELAFGLEDAP